MSEITYRIKRPDHAGNPSRSGYPGEYALHLDTYGAGVEKYQCLRVARIGREVVTKAIHP